MIRRTAFISAIVLSLAACGGDDEPAGVISREKFVRANVAVRSLGDDAPAERRAEVLRRHGVTERQMKAWVRAQSRDPETLARAWEEIAFKLDSIGGLPPGGVRPPSAGGTLPPSAGGTPPPPPPPSVQTGRRMPGGPPPPIRRGPRPIRPDSLAKIRNVQ
ncbi:MAG TPA: hypothetical protein VHG08_29275 [Longimicrobium sp.]|nr:hypothetical protein [Longimicrobium sp.]